MREISRISGISLALALTLAGCSEAAQPQSLPSVESLASELAASSTPSASALPDLKPTGDPAPTPTASAVEFVDQYMRLIQKSIRSAAALEERRSAYSSSCSVCESGAIVAEQVLATGLNVRGGDVEHTADVLSVEDNLVLIAVTYSISAIELRDSEGRVVQSAPQADEVRQVFQVASQNDGSWVILSIDELQ
jgi:hypothetical protein